MLLLEKIVSKNNCVLQVTQLLLTQLTFAPLQAKRSQDQLKERQILFRWQEEKKKKAFCLVKSFSHHWWSYSSAILNYLQGLCTLIQLPKQNEKPSDFDTRKSIKANCLYRPPKDLSMFALNPKDDCQMKFNRPWSTVKSGLRITFRYCCLKMASVTQLWNFQLLFRGQKPGNAFRTHKDTSLLVSDSHGESHAQSNVLGSLNWLVWGFIMEMPLAVLTLHCFRLRNFFYCIKGSKRTCGTHTHSKGYSLP